MNADFCNDHVVAWFQKGYRCDDLSAIPQLPAALKRGVTVAVCTYKRATSLNRFLDSLSLQDRIPEHLVIADASPNDETERVLRGRPDVGKLAAQLLYFRVQGPLKGLTRQRNFALRWVETDLVAFFDDDIVLAPDCLGEMAKAHRSSRGSIAGIGALMHDRAVRPGIRWRLMAFLYMVPHLRPGTYCRSGLAVPWRLLDPTDELYDGDFLPGGAVMWDTAAARNVGFSEQLQGYCQGEDLEFSLRIRDHGRLVIASRARVRHLTDRDGRPDPFQKGYMEIYNHYYVHRSALRRRTWRDVTWFSYAWTLHTLFLTLNLFRPSHSQTTVRLIAGRCKAAWDIATGR